MGSSKSISLRLESQRPGDADALLLAARELARIGVLAVLESDLLEQHAGLGDDLVRRPALGVDRAPR